jgi:urea transport system substrate-binding protein
MSNRIHTLRDVVLMALEEINAKGGVLGRKLQAVVVDPVSNWDLFFEKAKQLLLQGKVAAMFGCWTSVSRKSVLPMFEKNNGLLFYPVRYEGEESSHNVFYTGVAVNQQVIPAVEFLISKEGGGFKKSTSWTWTIRGRPIRSSARMLLAKKVPEANIIEEYTPGQGLAC